MLTCKRCSTALSDAAAKFCGQCGHAASPTIPLPPDETTDIHLPELRLRCEQWINQSNLKKKRKLLVKGQQLKQLQQYSQCDILGPHGTDFLQQSLNQQNLSQRNRRWIDTSMTGTLIIILLILSTISFFMYSHAPNSAMVTSLDDHDPSSLPQIVEQVSPGTTITFAPNLKGQTIHLTSDLIINKPITLPYHYPQLRNAA